MVMNIIKKIWGWIKTSKLKFVVAILSAVFFMFVLFPFEDLSDLVTAQISKATQNQVYVQFENMNLNLLPEPGIELSEVYVETPMTPPLSAEKLALSPSISGLISKKPMGSISAKGFLKGDLELQVKSGSKTETGLDRQKINLVANKLSLQDLRSLAQLPVLLKGNLNVSTLAQADLTFAEQPEADLTLEIDKFELPPSNVQTPMGPFTLPDLKLGKVELKGRLSNGRFNIESGTIGNDNDEVQGIIKGGISLTLNGSNGGVSPIFGAYNLDIALDVKSSFQEKANLFLSFLDSYKSPSNKGAKYSFKVSGASFRAPPNITGSR